MNTLAHPPTQSQWAHAARAHARAMAEHDAALKAKDDARALRIAQEIFSNRERLLTLHQAEQAHLLRQGIG